MEFKSTRFRGPGKLVMWVAEKSFKKTLEDSVDVSSLSPEDKEKLKRGERVDLRKYPPAKPSTNY